MKFIIIGLGNFGFALAVKLAQLGHEVIGVDKQMDKIEGIAKAETVLNEGDIMVLYGDNDDISKLLDD